MRNNSQKQQHINGLKETLHKLQLKDASQRLEIAKLKKILCDKDQECEKLNEELNELKRIQQRDSQYIMKIDNYVMDLKQKLNKANIKITSLESKLNSSRIKHESYIDENLKNISINTEPSQSQIKSSQNSSTRTTVSNKPKLICKPVKFQLPQPIISYTEQSDINDNQSIIVKPSPLQEQILNRMLDDEEFSTHLTKKLAQLQINTQKNEQQTKQFVCNSRQSNFSFANSEKKPIFNNDKRGSNRQYHSVSTDDKENCFTNYN